MQRSMCLRRIPGIVFKLGMQFGAYFTILAAKLFFQMTKYYFHYAYIQLQIDEDTGS